MNDQPAAGRPTYAVPDEDWEFYKRLADDWLAT